MVALKNNMIKRKKKTFAKIWCSIRGHKYPIKWSKEKWPNGEEVETGMADTKNPCFRCGQFAENPIIDIEKMFFGISNRLDNIQDKIDELNKKVVR